MPGEGLKIEESRGAGPAEAGDQDEDRLSAAGKRVDYSRKKVSEGPQVVLELVREREVNVREGLSAIKALEKLVLIALEHRGVDELLDVLPGNLNEASEYFLHQGDRRAAVSGVHPDADDTGERQIGDKLVSGLPEGALIVCGNEYALPAAGGHDIAVLLLKILVETPGHPDSPLNVRE